MNTRLALVMAIAAVGALAVRPALAQDPERGFAESVVGTWTGEGAVTGTDVTLERAWTRELGGRFLRAEMVVRMSNELRFDARTYWRRAPTGAWDVHWMDEAGQTRDFRGTWDPATRTLTAHYLEDTSDEAPGWRRIRYRIVDDDHYEELLDVETADGWTRIGEFRFTRVGPAAAARRGADAPGRAGAGTAEAVAEIEAASRAFAAAQRARDGEAAVAFLAREFYMYGDGTRWSREETAAGIERTLGALRSFEPEWLDLEVRALGPDHGLATFRFRDVSIDAEGERTVRTGPTTLIWARRDGEWRIVYADADHYPAGENDPEY